MTQNNEYMEVAANGLREQVQAIDAEIHRAMSGLLEQRTGLTKALEAMGFDAPAFKLDAEGLDLFEVPVPVPPRPPEADQAPLAPAPVADEGETQVDPEVLARMPALLQRDSSVTRAAAERQALVYQFIDQDGSPISTEIVRATGFSKQQVGDYLRALAEAGLIEPTGNRRPDQPGHKHAVEYRVRSTVDVPLERVRDVVCDRFKQGTFTVPQIAREVNGSENQVLDHVMWLADRQIVRPTGHQDVDEGELFEYVDPRETGPGPGAATRRSNGGPIDTTAGLTAALDNAQSQRIPAHRGARPVAGTGRRGTLGQSFTNNKAVNQLITDCINNHGATVNPAGHGVKVQFPNQIMVLISSSPGPEAIGLIRKDLLHAQKGEAHLIAQGGMPGQSL